MVLIASTSSSSKQMQLFICCYSLVLILFNFKIVDDVEIYVEISVELQKVDLVVLPLHLMIGGLVPLRTIQWSL